MSPIVECQLCDELTAGTQGCALWPKLVGPASGDRIVLENDAYVALVTVGPIVRGHCLVVSRAHRLSMTSDDPKSRQLLTEIFQRLAARLQSIYSEPVLFFEHGAAEGSDVRPCTVAHAHWHVLPTTLKVEDLLLSEYSWSECDTPWVHADREYLLVGDACNRYWVTYPETRIPSQLLRKTLAEQSGSTRPWDWRNEPAVEVALDILADLREGAI